MPPRWPATTGVDQGGTEDALGEVASSVLHCVDAVVTIEEPEKLLEEEVEIRWQFFSDPSTGLGRYVSLWC